MFLVNLNKDYDFSLQYTEPSIEKSERFEINIRNLINNTALSSNEYTKSHLITVEEMEVKDVKNTAVFDSMNDLKKYYNIADINEVFGFLMNHPELIDILYEAYNNIHTYFANNELSLWVYFDPEDSEVSFLVLSIISVFNPEESFNRFRQFKLDWWLNILPETKGLLCIKVDFL